MDMEGLGPNLLRDLCKVVKEFKAANPGVLEAITEERHRKEAETAKMEETPV